MGTGASATSGAIKEASMEDLKTTLGGLSAEDKAKIEKALDLKLGSSLPSDGAPCGLKAKRPMPMAALTTSSAKGTPLHELKGRWLEEQGDDTIFVRIEDTEDRSKLLVIITHESERVELQLWQGDDQEPEHFLLAARPEAIAEPDAVVELPDIAKLEKNGASWVLNILDPTTKEISMQWQATEDREVEAKTPKIVSRRSGRRMTKEGLPGVNLAVVDLSAFTQSCPVMGTGKTA